MAPRTTLEEEERAARRPRRPRWRQQPQALLAPALAGLATLGLSLVVQLQQPLLIGLEIAALLALLYTASHVPPEPLRIAVLGSAAATEALAADLATRARAPHVVGRITQRRPALPDDRWLGSLEDMRTLVQEHGIDLLLLCGRFPRMAVFDELERHSPNVPVRLCELSAFYEDHFRQVPIADINSAWFQCVLHPRHRIEAPASKRIFDVIASVVTGVAAAPLLLVLAVLIRRDGGPALYRQVRVGERGKPFTILKLRTMRHHTSSDAPWTRAGDDRITPLGTFLRRTHLDELPQLVNVLRGEMSIVGPRPEQPQYVASLERSIPFYSRRQQLRPGITGWAQINCGYAGSQLGTTLKLSHDLYYLKRRSLMLDLEIVARTVATPFTQQQFAEPVARPFIIGLEPDEPEGSPQIAVAPQLGSVTAGSA